MFQFTVQSPGMFRHMFSQFDFGVFRGGRGFQRLIEVYVLFKYVHMFEHTTVEQKNKEFLKTPLLDIDAVGELVAPVVPYIVLDRSVPYVVNKTFPEQDRKIRIHF